MPILWDTFVTPQIQPKEHQWLRWTCRRRRTWGWTRQAESKWESLCKPNCTTSKVGPVLSLTQFGISQQTQAPNLFSVKQIQKYEWFFLCSKLPEIGPPLQGLDSSHLTRQATPRKSWRWQNKGRPLSWPRIAGGWLGRWEGRKMGVYYIMASQPTPLTYPGWPVMIYFGPCLNTMTMDSEGW